MPPKVGVGIGVLVIDGGRLLLFAPREEPEALRPVTHSSTRWIAKSELGELGSTNRAIEDGRRGDEVRRDGVYTA